MLKTWINEVKMMKSVKMALPVFRNILITCHIAMQMLYVLDA
jgi:hypothetical protein